jgi:hypothetical protein
MDRLVWISPVSAMWTPSAPIEGNKLSTGTISRRMDVWKLDGVGGWLISKQLCRSEFRKDIVFVS